MKKQWLYIGILFYSVAFYWSCSGGGHKGNMEVIREKTEPITYDMSSLTHAQNMALVLTSLDKIDSQFYIPARMQMIKSFPCSNCHTQPIEKLKSKDDNPKKAHWDVVLNHAGELSMNCATCHEMNKPDQLASLVDGEISIDHSYTLCGQCHSTQFKDWKGGAHGKRLAGWLPPRISQTCVGCHNPHAPGFAKRWPSRLNTKKIELKESH